MLRPRLLAVAALLASAPLVPAQAAPVVFTGEDIMAATTDPHPNSTLAASAFDAAAAALGAASLITFEGAPVGPIGNLVAAPGVTLSGTDYGGAAQTILDSSNSPDVPTLDGYNTTAGGSRFAEMQAGTLTFTFTTPIQAFGAFFSGVQSYFYQDLVTFSDGSSQSIAIPETGTGSGSLGALSFAGFTDAGASITAVTIQAGADGSGDFIGVDDVRYLAAPAAVPEPGSAALLLGGLLSAAAAWRRRTTRWHPG